MKVCDPTLAAKTKTRPGWGTRFVVDRRSEKQIQVLLLPILPRLRSGSGWLWIAGRKIVRGIQGPEGPCSLRYSVRLKSGVAMSNVPIPKTMRNRRSNSMATQPPFLSITALKPWIT
jgi:hypothetical protein